MFGIVAMMVDQENAPPEPPRGGESGLMGTLVWTLGSTIGGTHGSKKSNAQKR